MSVISHGVTIFVGAFLLFWVQPLFARMLLPRLGGVPSVWNTSMVFFQAALLGGYLWAHFLGRFRPRIQVALHGMLLGLALLALPLRLDPRLVPPAAGNLAGWLILVLAASVGLPAVAVSSTSPLLQRWFSGTEHPEAGDPYFLYGTSNLGSMAALVAYPTLLEPFLSLHRQGLAWSAAFLLLALLTIAAGIGSRPAGASRPEPRARAPAKSKSASRWLSLRWLLLAFAPSSLLLGVTTHLTTDIASVPLLWVVPLFLYLLTYVMAFGRRSVIPERLLLGVQAFSVVPLAVVFAAAIPRVEKEAALLPLHLIAFFLTALVCHRELARLRPSPEHLTRYYLFISTGGVLGGIFNALVAPLLFRTLIEYQIILVAACLLRPWGGSGRFRKLDLMAPLLLLAVLTGGGLATRQEGQARWILLGAGGAACLFMMRRPLRFSLALAALVLAGRVTHPPLGITLAASRNFFGPVEVMGDATRRILYHGRTIHGAQIIDQDHRRTPLAYYTTTGPLGEAFRALSPRLDGARIAVIGLGAGALAAYGRPGQEMVFYEINPAVAAMAVDSRIFSYLADSPAAIKVRLGDGRLGVAAAPDGEYSLIIVDAFNSDAVPVHLLTREALDVYRVKLSPGGIILFNLTNDYLDLEPVVGRAAAANGLASLASSDDSPATEDIPFKLPSDWMAVARAEDDLQGLSMNPGWRRGRYRADSRPWSDDYSSILGTFRR